MELMIFIIPFAIWVILSFVVSSIGKGRKIGRGNVFIISFLFSPIIGALVGLGSERLPEGYVTEALKQQACALFFSAAKKASQEDFQGAINDLIEAVRINPQYGLAYYNLACYYGILKMIGPSFKYLSMAVENGYSDFQKIAADPDLAILHSHPDYPSFANNGYKFISSFNTIGHQSHQNDINVDIIDKIERLSSLKDNGILTEEEFKSQKNKLLNKEA